MKMGLSSLTAMTSLAFIVLLTATGLMMMQDGRSDIAAKDRGGILEQERKSHASFTDFNATNITLSTVNVTLYLENTGSTNMRASCMDLFIDDSWVTVTGSRVAPAAFDPMLWNPSETLLLSAEENLAVGEHNATVITCAGQRIEAVFNASRCGDGICTGGEYCSSDDGACDLLCYYTRCEDGCFQELVPAGGTEATGLLICDETGAGCDTDSCVCDGAGGCCGAGGSSCSQDSQCCSGSCPPPGPKTCTPYP